MVGRILKIVRGNSKVTFGGIKGGHPYENMPELGYYYTGYGGISTYGTPTLEVQWLNLTTGKVEYQNIRAAFMKLNNVNRITQQMIAELNRRNSSRVVHLKWSTRDRCRIISNLKQLDIVL